MSAAASPLAGVGGARKSAPAHPDEATEARVMNAIASACTLLESDQLDTVFSQPWIPYGAASVAVGSVDACTLEASCSSDANTSAAREQVAEYRRCLRYWASLGWPSRVRKALCCALYCLPNNRRAPEDVRAAASHVLANKTPPKQATIVQCFEPLTQQAGIEEGGTFDLLAHINLLHGWHGPSPTSNQVLEAVRTVGPLREVIENVRRWNYTGSCPSRSDEGEMWLSVPVYDDEEDCAATAIDCDTDIGEQAERYMLTLVIVDVTTD